ncbi:GolD/DthD family dehydrogenase [Herbaspirillum robiniae]|uniref:GolD/DthD family dehydrogenase n=1 Tax=Herbaspirillum robiniae TaxID=2014887 RepID=UPI003D774DD5
MNSPFSLQDQVAIVTGGASGIGYEIARRLRDAGATIALVDRDPDVFHQAQTLGDRVSAHRFDLSRVDDLHRLATDIADAHGQIDILINNAGIGILEPVGEVQLSSWNSTMLINLTAPFFLAQHCARFMKMRGGGRIINIASQASVVALDEHAAYCASKAGMLGFTRVLAAELGPHGITANAVSPTVVETTLGKVYWNGERAAQMKRKIPVRRFAATEEIAAAVLYLSSKEAGIVNGENLMVDGGYSAI